MLAPFTCLNPFGATYIFPSAPSINEQSLWNFAPPAIIAAIISIAINSYFQIKQSKSTRTRHIDNMIQLIIKFSIKYPYLESDTFPKQWTEHDADCPKRLRYETYCCMVFNTIKEVYNFCNGDIKKIKEILHVEELAVRHLDWWKQDETNADAYSGKFKNFIQQLTETKGVANGTSKRSGY